MNLRTVETPDGAPNPHIARIARVLAECLDPDDEYDCEVSLLTATPEALDDHPASDIPTGGYEYRYDEYGLELIITFEDTSDYPSGRASRLIEEYSDATDLEHGISYQASFRGGDGSYHALAFPVLDAEFTCGVSTPTWA